jgi:hypothetical protein
LSGTPLLLVALGVVVLIQGIFVFSYVGALHDPKSHGLPLGVTGSSPLVAAVDENLPLDTTEYPDESAVNEAIDERDIYGGLVVGPTQDKLIVAPAAGRSVAQNLALGFEQAASVSGRQLTVEEVHPLGSGDSQGTVSFFVILALVTGGYLAATIATNITGVATQRERGMILAGTAVVGALVTYLVAGPLLDGIPSGHFWALWPIFTLVMLAVAYATAALQGLLGTAGTLVVILLFVVIGAPSSAGSVANEFLPGFWRALGPLLPPGAGVQAVRNTIYFDGNAIVGPLIVLFTYLIAGGLIALTLRLRRERRVLDRTTEAEASGASTAVG